MIKKTLIAVCTLIVSLGGIYGASKVLGFQLDRPLWATEFQQFAGMVSSDLIIITQRRLLDLEKEMRAIQDKNKTVPGWMIKERGFLLRKIRKYNEQLEK